MVLVIEEQELNFFIIIIIFKIGFTPCKAEQPQQGMELQKKKHKKIKPYRKSL